MLAAVGEYYKCTIKRKHLCSGTRVANVRTQAKSDGTERGLELRPLPLCPGDFRTTPQLRLDHNLGTAMQLIKAQRVYRCEEERSKEELTS